jgi:hypothetical protein
MGWAAYVLTTVMVAVVIGAVFLIIMDMYLDEVDRAGAP